MAGCAAVAVASLVVAASPAYDVWAWLVWGREVAHLDLSTVGGPSWKPLPVLATALVSLVGGAAPTVWLAVARTMGLLTVVGVFRLASRIAGAAAGAVAVLFLVLTPDGEVRFLRVVLEGHTAATTAGLAIWAIECHLARRTRLALALLFLLALDRPEAWPFLLGDVLWCWRAGRTRAWLPAALLVAVPVLWFGGDWWGSGSPWHGADAARVVASQGHRLGDALARVVHVLPWVAWVAAAYACARACVRRERLVLALAALAGAWSLLVVAMSAVLGYAALSRFLLPAAAVLCVLAGAGTVWAVTAFWRFAPALAVGVVVVAAVAVGFRASAFPAMFDELARRDRLVHGLDAVIERAGGVDGLAACGAVAISSADVPRVALAWKLDLPMADVRRSLPDSGGVLLVDRDATGARRAAKVAERFGPGAVDAVARWRDWTVLSVGCRTPE